MQILNEEVKVGSKIPVSVSKTPVSGDMIVPDSMPDIFEILSCNCFISSLEKEIMSGRLIISGNLNFDVLYRPEGSEEIMKLSKSIDFKTDAACPDGEFEEIRLSSVLESCDAQIENSRKILISASLGFFATLFKNESINIPTETNKIIVPKELIKPAYSPLQQSTKQNYQHY